MGDFTEILKYVLPALLVMLASILTLRVMMKNEEKKRNADLMMGNRDATLPLRLQAYERLVLFLERMSPDSLIMRVSQSNLNNAQMQNELINIIRTEFDHNLAQQIYVSSKAWEAVKNARNNIIKLVNDSASELKPDASGMSLNKKLLEKVMELKSSPVDGAIEILKNEVRGLF